MQKAFHVPFLNVTVTVFVPVKAVPVNVYLGEKYGGGYSEARLRGWAEWLNARRDQGYDVYAYFNNDIGGHAPRDAMTLRRALEETA